MKANELLYSMASPVRNLKAINSGILGTFPEIAASGQQTRVLTFLIPCITCEAFYDPHETNYHGLIFNHHLSPFPSNRVNHYFYLEWFSFIPCSLQKKKKVNFLCLNKKKDTCNIIEKILILEISLLANLVDSFQEEILSPWPLLLKQDDHMPQCHVVPAVRESP